MSIPSGWLNNMLQTLALNIPDPAPDMRSHDPVSTDRNVGALPDCTAVWASILFQELQTCTPMVVPLGFETPLRDPRGLYKGYMKAILGKPFRVTAFLLYTLHPKP